MLHPLSFGAHPVDSGAPVADDTTETSATPVWSWRHTALFVATLALLSALPWTVHHWPSQDGQNHLAVAHVLLHYDDPGSPFPQYVTVQKGLRPSTAVYSILCALGKYFPLQTAEKGLVSLAIFLLPLSALIFTARALPRRKMGVFLALPLATGWAFGMGFLSFQLGLAFGVLTLAFTWSRARASGARESGAPPARGGVLGVHPRHIVGALTFWLCVWFHPVTGAMTGMVLLLLEWRTMLRPSEWPRLIVVVGPALVFLAVSYAAAEPAILQTNTPPVETNWSDPASLIGGLFEYQVTFTPFELAPRLVAIGILVRFAFQELRARWAYGVRTAWPLGAGAEGGIARVVVALVLLYAVVPNAYRGWFYCSTRFLLMAWLLLPALAEIPPRLARKLPALGAALSVIVLLIQLPDLWRSSRQMQNILDVGKTLPKGAKIIPMDFSPRLLGPKPLGHAWAELVVERDVVASQLFASGKPRMGGERFRTLSFYPGLLDTASGRLPWSTYETWSEVVRDCIDRSSPECEKSLAERRSELETVVDRYDYVLMIDPPEYGRDLIGEHLTLRSHIGSAWLYEVKKEERARSASR